MKNYSATIFYPASCSQEKILLKYFKKNYPLIPYNTLLSSDLPDWSVVLLDSHQFFNKKGIEDFKKQRPWVFFVWINPQTACIYPASTIFFTLSSHFKENLTQILKAVITLKGQGVLLEEQETQIFKTEERIQELQSIAIALSTQKNLSQLLKTIIRFAMEGTYADAVALYLIDLEQEQKILRFMLNENFSLKINTVPFTMPCNTKSIAGYVAITNKILNIPDSYQLTGKEEYTHSKKFDTDYNYRTVSMLTLPMVDFQNRVIGVMQLINKKDSAFTQLLNPQDFIEKVVPFSKEDEAFAYALSSQAAIALENTKLYESIEKLFEGFIKASIKAIESRDPVTSGHSDRVALYSLELAKAFSIHSKQNNQPPFFSEAQLKELYYAALLHDFGKVGVKEEVLRKENKLSDAQLEIILTRIEVLLLEYEKNLKPQEEIEELKKLYFALPKINKPSFLQEEDRILLKKYEKKTYTNFLKEEKPLFEPLEFQKLFITKGNLNEEERAEIEKHVTHSYWFLKEIPWTDELSQIPQLAYGHHEKLSGKGYPRGLKGAEISLGQRIIAIADIFDALTAEDRPYKKPFSIEKALAILQEECDLGSLDLELFTVFKNYEVYQKIKNPHYQLSFSLS